MNASVVVTGCAGGIGVAICDKLLASDFNVIGLDLSSPSIEREGFSFIEADLEKLAQDSTYARTVFDKISAHLMGNSLFGLVNNAAVQILGSTNALTRDDWLSTLSVNLLAPFFIAQHFLADLEASRGAIINISSIHSKLSKDSFTAYAVSKAALSQLTRSMALELGSKIRINAIEPAAINTPMLEAGFIGKPEKYEALEKLHPSHCIGTVDEVADLVLYIMNGGSFLNGSCIELGGGIHGKLCDP